MEDAEKTMEATPWHADNAARSITKERHHIVIDCLYGDYRRLTFANLGEVLAALAATLVED